MEKEKYMYNGMSLYNYCKENDLPYACIIQKVKRIKEKKGFLEIPHEELLSQVVNSYDSNIGIRDIKYTYNNTSFYKYCQKNQLPYTSFIKKIRMLKEEEKYANISIAELIECILAEYHGQDKISNSLYMNVDLVEYCQKNQLSYHFIREKVRELKYDSKFDGFSYEKLSEIAIEMYIEEKKMYVRTKYYYENKSLFKFCKETELSYRYVIIYLNRLKVLPEYMHMPIEKLIDITICEYANKHNKEKNYYYNGKSLFDYCKEHKLEYCKLIVEINALKTLNTNINVDVNQLIKKALNKEEKEEVSLEDNLAKKILVLKEKYSAKTEDEEEISFEDDFAKNLLLLKAKYRTKIEEAQQNALNDNDYKVKLKK